MKRIMASIGFIVAFLAIFMGLQFWYIMTVSIIIGVQIGFQSGLAGYATPDPEQINIAVQDAMILHLPLVMIFSALLSGMIYFFICRARKQDIKMVCAFNCISVKSVIVFLFTGIVMLFFNSSLNTLIYESGVLKDSFQQLENLFAPFYEGNFVLGFLSIAIIVPLIEEIIFRGLIQNELRIHMKILPAVLIQAVLFGLYHLNPAQMIFTALMGIILGFLCAWTKSIWGAIIIHSVNNALSFLFAWFVPETAQENYFIVNYVILALTVLIIAVVMIYYYKKSKEISNQSAQTSEIPF